MKLPLKLKGILLIVLTSLLIGATGIIFYGVSIKRLVINEYKSRSIDITQAMAKIVDSSEVRTLRDEILDIYYNVENRVLSDEWGTPEFEEYISHYSEIENTPEFQSLRNQLRKVQNEIEVDCLYINWLIVEDECYIYLVDAANEDACPPGCVDPLFLGKGMTLENLADGCPPNMTRTEEYGYLMTTGMPIYDGDEIVGYATVDMSMNEILSYERRIMLISILVFVLGAVIASLVGIIAVDRTIVRPINKLSKAANDYAPNKLNFSSVDIHTGDEIETLSNSIKRMETDIQDYYRNLMEAKNDLETAKEHAEVYKREANIDFLTGLNNKRAYDLEVAELEKNNNQYAIVMIDLNDLKYINDMYGHENGDITIKKLASMICSVFKNSAIFRFGGDEFVVIVKEEKLSSLNQMIKSFKEEVSKSSNDTNLNPWERISAACGFAKFDKKLDASVQSVFKRADDNMYIEKDKMKSNSSYQHK